jgi:hypothetical protein
VVRDHREVVVDGATLCRPCAHGAYYTNAREIAWPDMNWAPKQSCRLTDARRKNKARRMKGREMSAPEIEELHTAP